VRSRRSIGPSRFGSRHCRTVPTELGRLGRPGGQQLEAQVVVLEPQVGGPVQAHFHQELIVGLKADRLLGQQLEPLVVEAQGEVLQQGSGAAQREDFLQAVAGQQRPMSVAGLGGFHGATSIMIGEIDPPEKRVSRLQGRDAGQAELFDQAVLMRLKTSLHPAFGLRAVGPDQLDAQFFDGPAELGRGLAVPQLLLDTGLAIDFVDGVFIHVEGHRTAITLQIAAGCAQQGEGVFRPDKLGLEDAAGGIIHIEQQHAARASPFQPVMLRAVQLDQHAQAAAALPPGPLFLPTGFRFPDPRPDHVLAQAKGGELKAVDLFQLLPGQCRAEVAVAGLDQL
jgi:hypothetical protein